MENKQTIKYLQSEHALGHSFTIPVNNLVSFKHYHALLYVCFVIFCYESKRISMPIALFHRADYGRSQFSFCRKNSSLSKASYLRLSLRNQLGRNSRLSLEAHDYFSHSHLNMARIQFHLHSMINAYYTIDSKKNESIY